MQAALPYIRSCTTFQAYVAWQCHEQGSRPEEHCSSWCRLLRLRHVVDVVPALSAAAEVTASRTDLESFILRLTVQVHRTAVTVSWASGKQTLCSVEVTSVL